MTHPREDLTALLDGALAPDRAAEVQDHLARCAACREESARLRAGVAALSSLPPAPELPPFFATRLEARLREERERRRGLAQALRAGLERWLPRPRALASAAAGATLLAALGVGTWRFVDARRMVRDLDLLEDYEVASAVGVETPEDAEIVARLDELAPAQEGTP